MNKSRRTFINASIISVIIISVILALTLILYRISDLHFYRLIMGVLIAIISAGLIMIIISAITILSVNNSKFLAKKNITGFTYWLLKNLIMPIVDLLPLFTRLDKEQLERFYIDFNNSIVKSMDKKVDSSNIILLLPHCLQNQSCGVKITSDIYNCKRCGKCDISSLIELSDELGIKPMVVTGGTAARAKLAKLKPSAVVSVACERDLASGIKDVENLPVIGVINLRPNGPCCNTHVDVEEVRAAVSNFLVR